MSQWMADSLRLPVSGIPAPRAMWKLPQIFSPNSVLPVARVIPLFVPMANSRT